MSYYSLDLKPNGGAQQEVGARLWVVPHSLDSGHLVGVGPGIVVEIEITVGLKLCIEQIVNQEGKVDAFRPTQRTGGIGHIEVVHKIGREFRELRVDIPQVLFSNIF